MSDEPYSYVIRTGDGNWRVAGTRVSLASVVHAYWEGQAAEEIAREFRSLTLEQIHGALAYYLRNRAEADAYLASQDAHWRAARRASAVGNAPLLDRLRRVKAQSGSLRRGS